MRFTKRWMALFAALAIVVTACGGDDDGSDTESPDTGGEETSEPADGGGEGAEQFDGEEITVFGAFTSVEADAVNNVIDEYINQPLNLSANYEGSESFEEQIKIRVEGGNPPDIALYPQPGSVIEQAEQGNAIALEDLGFDIQTLNDTFGEYLMSLGEYEGKHYGIPTNVNLKSLIWYNLPVFEAQGYEVPETWDDLLALNQQMVDDGFTPWCIGTGSDAATGWPATDWMEDIMLRTAGAETYDQWVSHEIPFTDDAVKNTAETFAEVAFNEDFIVGNTGQIPDLDFRDAPDGLVTPSVEEPTCLLHRQASFIVNFFPEGTEVGTDVGVFAFPEIDQQGALIAGEVGAVFRDAPEVKAFIEAFISTEAQCAQGGQEGVQRISPNINTTADCYGSEIVATAAESTINALAEGTARFDASDLMPSAVGSGSFWTGMNEWMRGKPLDQVLQEIEDSWPAE